MLQYRTIEPSTLELLKQIQSLNLFSNCRLVGGTSLALQYGHRKSIDLDFFGSFNTENLELQSVLSQIGTLQIIQESTFIYQYVLNNIKIDFVNYPYPWLKESIIEDGIILASPEDIAAMKLSAITNRGTKKDFIDLYELLTHYTLSQILDFYKQKYKTGIPFMTLKSLVYFDDAETDPMPFMFSDYNWTQIKETILSEVTKLAL